MNNAVLSFISWLVIAAIMVIYFHKKEKK